MNIETIIELFLHGPYNFGTQDSSAMTSLESLDEDSDEEDEQEAMMDPEVETSSPCTLSSHEPCVTPDLWQHPGSPISVHIFFPWSSS